MGLQIKYVEPILFGYMFCAFLNMPMEQQLVYQKLCNKHFNGTFCEKIYTSHQKQYGDFQNMIQKETAQWIIYLNVAKTIPAAVSTILFGIWSDRFGRKFFMILPIIGDLILAISSILNSYFFHAPVSYMLIGTIITAMFGNFAAILSATFSYVADVSDKSSRTKRMVILESMVYFGSVVSNISGGWLLQKSGFVAVFSLIAAALVAQIIYLFFLKESYKRRLSKDKKEKTLNCNAIKESLDVIFKRRKERFRFTLMILLSCFTLLILFFVAVNSVSILFMLHQPLNFAPSAIGYFLAGLNGVKFIGALLVNFILIHRYKWTDYSVILLASVMYCGFALSMGLANKYWHVYVGILWCLGLGTGTSSARAGLSKIVTAKEQGKLFSVLSSIEVVISLISSTGFTAIYKSTLDLTPSFSFYLLAGLTVFPFTFSIILKIFGQKSFYEVLEDKEEDEETEKEEKQTDVANAENYGAIIN
ncbi:proton-coupled folate transporter-like isoform X2 [Hydractinia symbiolongicarpus]|uniref:proton-coupled folate transporter-like isoform X2 n=1 Tax=Hydractinia symbiolongicarpus TaxID=13093 RepID=UPI00254A2F59|nr:proton-coupled folate transporter-like isoform X2 [Hydractinia symbiolongicarpus]